MDNEVAMRSAQARHAPNAWLHWNRRKASLPDGHGEVRQVSDRSSTLFASCPGAGGEAAVLPALVGIGPADVLLQFDRQGADRPLGEIAGTGFAVFGSDAAEIRQDRHDTNLSRF